MNDVREAASAAPGVAISEFFGRSASLALLRYLPVEELIAAGRYNMRMIAHEDGVFKDRESRYAFESMCNEDRARFLWAHVRREGSGRSVDEAEKVIQYLLYLNRRDHATRKREIEELQKTVEEERKTIEKLYAELRALKRKLRAAPSRQREKRTVAPRKKAKKAKKAKRSR